MKRIMLGMIFFVSCAESKHQLVTIYNASDLKFEFAHHKGKQMPILTEKLQKSSKDGKKHVFINQYKVDDQKGLSITMSNSLGTMYDVHTDDQSVVSIKNKRKKIQKIAKFDQNCVQGNYCARAVLNDTKTQKTLASTSYGHEDQELLNLHISGISGNYQLSYEHAS